MDASERMDAGGIDGEPLERMRGRTAPRGLRRVAPGPQVARLDGPDARIAHGLRAVAERVGRDPLTSVVIAVGLGFVIGGALSFRAGRMALAAAARRVARELLKQIL